MVRRPSCRRKNILMRFIFLIVIIVHAIRDAGIEAAVFTKDANEDNDDLKTGPLFLKKRCCASDHISIPATTEI